MATFRRKTPIVRTCIPAPVLARATYSEDVWITASHELRKPITVAYGVLKTLQRPAPEVDRVLQEELVAVAVRQVQMIGVVDEITPRGEDIPHTSYADHMKYAV